MQVETVNIPGVGVFNHVCDHCHAGPLFPAAYRDKDGNEFCSPKCREGGRMKHPEFGGADVQAPTCDHCHGPIKVVALRGRYGRYCKQACLAEAESNLTDEEKKQLMAKKATTKKAVKTTRKPATKTAAKKSAKGKTAKAATASKERELFRPGATKYDIWKKLEPGKPVKREVLEKITADAGKTVQLIGFVLSRVKKEGYTVTRDKEKGTIQVTR